MKLWRVFMFWLLTRLLIPPMWRLIKRLPKTQRSAQTEAMWLALQYTLKGQKATTVAQSTAVIRPEQAHVVPKAVWEANDVGDYARLSIAAPNEDFEHITGASPRGLPLDVVDLHRLHLYYPEPDLVDQYLAQPLSLSAWMVAVYTTGTDPHRLVRSLHLLCKAAVERTLREKREHYVYEVFTDPAGNRAKLSFRHAIDEACPCCKMGLDLGPDSSDYYQRIDNQVWGPYPVDTEVLHKTIVIHSVYLRPSGRQRESLKSIQLSERGKV